MKGPAHLRNRLLIAVSGLALVTCIVFSFYTVAFTYSVEDAFLEVPLKTEAQYQRQAHETTGAWATPRDNRLSLHEDMASLPVAVRDLLREEPERREFAAPGPSHYHLLSLEAGGSHAWLLYDAGRDLIVREIRDQLFWLLGLTTLALMSCALWVGYLLARRVTRRLEHLAATVSSLDPAQMSADWRSASGPDEVGVVAAGLEAMTGRLREFIERERSFTRDASHELRTPLAVIRSAGEQLSHQPELGERARQHANLILESAQRLEQTVATLLALAREQQGGGATEAKLLPLIEQVVIDQAPRLEGKPVEVIVDVAADAVIPASPGVTRIVLANLIGNAFAHTAKGVVRIETAEDRLRIVNSLSPETDAPFGAGEGFGFGLGIVRRLCAQSGLQFELTEEADKVSATLSLRPTGV